MIEIFVCEPMDGSGDRLYFFRRIDLMQYISEHATCDVMTTSIMCTEETAKAFCEAARPDVTLH